MKFKIAVDLYELCVKPEDYKTFAHLHNVAHEEMADYYDHSVSAIKFFPNCVIADFDSLPAGFTNSRQFRSAYVEKLKEIAAPIKYTLH